MSSVVLLVEDDEDIRDVLTGLLRARGYRVIAARNGLEALSSVRGAALVPDVILLDLQMPVMDGESFLEAQVADPDLAGAPVIIATAQLQIPDPVPSTVRAVLAKPLHLAELLELIEALVRRDEAPPPAAVAAMAQTPDELRESPALAPAQPPEAEPSPNASAEPATSDGPRAEE